MFGSHLSISGGLHKALLSAESLKMDTVQVFTASPQMWGFQKTHYSNEQLLTKNQQQWKCKPLETTAISAWASEQKRLKFKRTVSHDSYLINLAAIDPALRLKSMALFVEELSRCEKLGIPYLVTHPGAHMGAGEAAGLAAVAEALDIIHQQVPDCGTITCLEITAGQGSSLGYKLEHLATIIELVDQPHRLGVCLDTAHLFAAGYDFRGRRYARFRKQLESTIGIRRVKVWHLNDSKKPLGSRVDRHEHIGRGHIGLDGFRPIVRDASWRKVPKILETAKGPCDDGREWDAVNLEALQNLL